MLVAAMLKGRGHEVLIYHDDVSNPQPIPSGPVRLGVAAQRGMDESVYLPFLKALDDFAPEVVGISYRTVDAQTAREFAAFARQRRIRVVAGGVHPSLLPEEEAKVFDAVVVGEGDHPAAAAAFEDFGTEIVRPPLVTDLDAVVPDRGCVIGGERYSPYITGMVQTQRGCPYACSYCAAPTVFGKQVRTRDPGHVREEVECLTTKQGRVIDDSFGVVRKHGLAVCRELAKTGFQWVCDAALQNVDEELVDALLEGGCRCVNIGLESASPRWRELSGKRVTDTEIERTISLTLGRGLRCVVYLLIGFPGETAHELEATLNLGRHLKQVGAKPHISVLTPYPGTRVYALAKALAGGLSENWSEYFHQSAGMGLEDCSEDEWRGVLREADRINA
jgi:radical SAM superfamily enzyme YgiQ (UPF0313 family)